MTFFFVLAKAGKGRFSSNVERFLNKSLFYSSLLLYYIKQINSMFRLFSNRSQMTSKCGKNKIVPHEAIAVCVAGWNLLDGGNVLDGGNLLDGGNRLEGGDLLKEGREGGRDAHTHARTNARMNGIC